jgi:UDP-N-acetylmuramate dehydrogenase
VTHSPGTATPTLAALTSIGLGGPARSLTTAATADEVAETVGAADRAGGALVLGGGSNVGVADAGIDVPVIRVAVPGVAVDADGVATIGAGVPWDDAVAELVEQGWAGVAALSGIPGSAGATPVQNVGAYGVEIKDMLQDVELFRRDTRQLVRLPAAALRLTYRSSVLKGTDRAVVTQVRLRLSRTPGPVRYPELARLLGVAVGDAAPAAAVREAVLALRRGTGLVLEPAVRDTASAGSFFTNPVVSADRLAQVRAAVAERLGPGVTMPEYAAPAGDSEKRPLDSAAFAATCDDAAAGANERLFSRTSPAVDAVKLSAAWLIERAGFPKGYPLAQRPGAGIALSTKHTLALTNRGHGTTAELLALAREVRDGVRAAFGVTLRPEPVLVGCSLE